MNCTVGQIVYLAYTPAVVGTIIEIIQRRNPVQGIYFDTLRIRWANPKRGVTEQSDAGLNDYETLVVGHERTAKRHREILERLRASYEHA